MLKSLTAPADNERGPRYMEKALAAIHQSLRHNQFVVFEYASNGSDVGLRVRCDDAIAPLITSPITANYPQCMLEDTSADPVTLPTSNTWATELRLVPELFPILRHGQFEDALNRNYADPINAILRAIKPRGDCH